MSRFDHLEIDDPSGWPNEELGDSAQDQYSFLEKANQAFSEGNFERALTLYSRSLQYDIDLEDAWVGQIRCLIELSELQEAIIWSDRAMERLPNSAPTLAARAVAELRLGRVSQALKFADGAITSQPVTAYVWIARGEVLIVANLVNAKPCFAKATEIAPSNANIHAWVGRAYAAHNCYHDALTHYRNAVRIDPQMFSCWYWIGNCCEKLGEINEAMIAYNRATSIRPAFHEPREALKRLQKQGAILNIHHWFKRSFGRR